MPFLENPVLQREILVNLRLKRAVALMIFYIAALGLVVVFAWPSQKQLDLAGNPAEARSLVNVFFLGQYILMALIVPSLAGGAISGEKERQTYEMLLASPMRPGAIIFGKLMASLGYLAVLVFASLPIVMLCLPLGGVSLYEVLSTYVAMAASVSVFGMICVTASGYFTRTIAAQVVSYLIILPLAMFGIFFYMLSANLAELRLTMLGIVFPAACAAFGAVLFVACSHRLLYPPDIGAEAKEVIDPELEQRKAMGMIIRSDRFPDMLFAPSKRADFMADTANPVFDKEMRSELFGQGTLMLRIVIQMSMFLALPLMAICLYIWQPLAPWYVSYVLLFNLLIGPVFSAGAFTSERERQTLDLLLTTTLSPWRIFWGKMLSSLRVSCVLTSFLAWPLLLSWLLLPPWPYMADSATFLAYFAMIVLCGLTTTNLAIACSVIFRKTSTATMTAYLILILVFALPLAAKSMADGFYRDVPGVEVVSEFMLVSPFATVFQLPITLGRPEALEHLNSVGPLAVNSCWTTFFLCMTFHVVLNLVLLRFVLWQFKSRWRVSQA